MFCLGGSTLGKGRGVWAVNVMVGIWIRGTALSSAFSLLVCFFFLFFMQLSIQLSIFGRFFSWLYGIVIINGVYPLRSMSNV